MKRLTMQGFEITSDYILSGLTINTITEMVKRLQEYEDTGLDPKDIREIIKNSNRSF